MILVVLALLTLTLSTTVLSGCFGLTGANQRAYDILIDNTDSITKRYAPSTGSSLGSTEIALALDPSTIRIESGAVSNKFTNNGSDILYCVITLEIAPGIRSEPLAVGLFPGGGAFFEFSDADGNDTEELALCNSKDLNCDAINDELKDHFAKEEANR
jgi:hypothetical protein